MSDATTIKVSKDLRDRLQDRATREHISMAGVIEQLLRTAARAERFERLRAERAAGAGADLEHDGALEHAALNDLQASGA